MLSMDLEWPIEPRHEQPMLSVDTSAHTYRTEMEARSCSTVSPEDHRNSPLLPSASATHPEQMSPPRLYGEHWLSHATPSNLVMPVMQSVYSYPSQPALLPISDQPRGDVKTHEGGRQESLSHGRGGQEEQQFWATAKYTYQHPSYDPDSLAPASSSSTSTLPDMLQPPGEPGTSPTSPHSPYEFPQGDEFYGSSIHEK